MSRHSLSRVLLFLGFLHVGVHLRECSEIVVDELSRLTVGNVHSLGQSVGGDTVYYSEVGLLGFLPLGIGNLVHILVPYLRCRGAVDVEPLRGKLQSYSRRPRDGP